MRNIVILAVVAIAGYAQNPGTPADNAPRRLTMEEAEAIAAKQNPRISAALLDALAAGQATLEARSNWFPQVQGLVTGAGGEFASRIAAGGISASTILNRVAGGISASQLLTDFGRTRQLVDAARFRATASDERSAFSKAVVLLQVRRSYFAGLRARAVLRVAEQTVTTRQVVAEQISALAQSNLRSGLDASFANVNLSEAKLLLAQARNEVRAADADLSWAMGYAQALSFELVETLPPATPSEDAASMIQVALRERSDVQSARTDLSAAQRFRAAESALSRPTVSAAAVVGYSPLHGNTITDRYSAAAITMSVPVFNGHLLSARREEASLRSRAVAERVRELETQVARDVQVAWLLTTNSFERTKLADELVKQASLALELSQARYDLGLSSIVELTQAQLSKTAAEIQRASALYEFQTQTSVLAYQQGLLR